MLDDLRRQFFCDANFPVGGIVLELKREEFQREFGKLAIADWRLPIGNQRAQPGGEIGKFWIHAVFVRGWFSATAGETLAENIFPGQARRIFLRMTVK
jgi:hypothetical protein